MPNWCFTDVYIRSDKKNLEKLNKALNEALTKPDTSDFGERWLGNILLYLGYDQEDISNCKTVRARGKIEDICDTDDDILNISVLSANVPHILPIKLLANKIIGEDDYKLTYTANEPDGELYWTNDPDIYQKEVYIDSYNTHLLPDEIKFLESTPDGSRLAVLKKLGEYFNLSDPDIDTINDELDELCENSDEDIFVRIHEYEFVRLKELE